MDKSKNDRNVEVRGISFSRAAEVFAGLVFEQEDSRRNYGETRIVAIGRAGDVVLVVVYTVRNGRRRIISARRANRREREAYDQSQS